MTRRVVPEAMRDPMILRGDKSVRELLHADWRTAVENSAKTRSGQGSGRLPAVTLLLAAVSLCAGSDGFTVGVDAPDRWADINASHHDRHLLGGGVLGAALFAGSSLVTDERPCRYALAVGGVAAAAVGVEVAEAVSDGSAMADPVDVAWTVAGGAIGAVATDLIGQAITVTPRRDGAAIAIAWRF